MRKNNRKTRHLAALLALGLVGGSLVSSLRAQDTDAAPEADTTQPAPDWLPALPDDPAQIDFAEHAQPHLEWYCYDCHDRATRKGGVVLSGIDSERALVEHFREWETVVDQLEGRTMPPMDADQPDEATRQRLAAYLRHVLDTYEPEGPPDPGPALSRRLTHFEYDNTVRDLTGVDLRQAARFPAEGGGGEGFTNNADTMFLSPLLMEKYLDASHAIVMHLEVSFLDGLVWHEQRLEERTRETWRSAARDRLSRYRYDRLDELDVFADDAEQLERYVPALYRYQHARLADDTLTIEVFAQREGVHAVYLQGLAAFFDQRPSDSRQIEQIVAAWHQLPEADADRSVQEQDALSAPAAAAMAQTVRRHPDKTVRWFSDGELKGLLVLQSGYRRLGQRPFAYDDAQMRQTLDEQQTQSLRHLQRELQLRDGANAQQERDALRQMLAPFTRRAYRRPLLPGELDDLMAFFDSVRDQSMSYEEAVRQVIRRILVSPHFLLRVEHDRPAEGESGAIRISDIELASRLSYLLWASMPDDALLDAAEAGRLKDDAELERQVRRMLADQKSAGFAQQMLGQWLGLTEVARTDGPDTEVFPAYDTALRDALVTEARLFLAELVRNDHPTLAVIDAEFTVVNEQLAQHYGLALGPGDESPDAWHLVSTEAEPRGGVLGMGAFHLLTSYPTRSSPVLRGQWVLGALLGSPTPPPPPNVGELPEGTHAEGLSLRERLSVHRADPACAVCHDRLDPVGFSMQRYDALGRWVEQDITGQPIDDRGTMPDGTELAGVNGLRAYLLTNKDRYYRQIARKTLGYAQGRELQYTDRPTLRRLESRLAEDDSFSALLIEVASSHPFQHRRAASADEVDSTEDTP